MGLSQKELAEKLGTTKDYIRSLEAGRNFIEDLKIAEKWTDKLNIIFSSTEIDFGKSLEFWKKYKFAREQDLPIINKKYNSISKMSEEELLERFCELKEKTNDFTEIESSILVNDPQSLLIFRLVLGFDFRSFASLVGKDGRTVRKYENSEMRMKALTANEFCSKLIRLFSEIKPKIDTECVLLNYRKFTNMFGNRNLQASFERGLFFTKEQRPSKCEEIMNSILSIENISFETNAIVQGLKRKYSVDFAIPNGEKPKFIIEVFDFSLKNKTVSNSKSRVRDIDQRFQMMKSVNPNLKTILGIRFLGRIILEELAMKSLEIEVINTDYIVLNNFENIPKILRNHC